MNTLSIVASFGALVWIFQDGNLSALLGFQPLGFVETTPAGDPVLRAVRALDGLRGVPALADARGLGSNRTTTARPSRTGLERSGRIVTSAALIVVVVAASFAFADIVLIKALGLGIAIAVALDATIVRALLVPATMRLLGEWNWWLPARLKRLRRRPAITAVARRRPPAPGCGGTAPILANPTVARPAPPATPSPTPRPPDPQPVDLPARRRAARSTDRVVVLHRPPAGDRPERPALRVRVRDLPRRARRLPGLVGLAPRADRRNRRPVPVRPAQRDRRQVDTSPRGVTGEPFGFELTVHDGAGRGARPGRRLVDGRLERQRPAARVRARVRARARALDRGARRSSTTRSAGSTSARRARPTTTRARRMAATGDVTLGDGRSRSRAAPGSTTSGATSSRSAPAAGTGSPSTWPTGRT